MDEVTTNSVNYDSNDYVLIIINIKEREERRRIRELNEKLAISRK